MAKKKSWKSKTPNPQEFAAGVHWLTAGRGPLAANVYFIRTGAGWVLVDTAWASHASMIRAAAVSLFGRDAPPEVIVLTHIHPDHSGSVPELARVWEVPVKVHPAEMQLAPGGYQPEYAHPLDRWVVAPMLRLVPRRRLQAMEMGDSLEGIASPLDLNAGIPALPDWQCVHTPGHTPGHAAFFRATDGVLITGDAVVTVDLNSVGGLLSGRQAVAGPPWYTTWDWTKARSSIKSLAELEPRILAPGHGRPLLTGTSAALWALAEGVTVRP